ncbi:hypothetical protein GOD96_29365 [Sinorhizobium medicae]|nr:hypothetical protein [Sinorhizobium medicae]
MLAVVSVDREGNEGIGAAFHVGDGVFVTARHVVEGMASCHIELDDYRLMRLAEDAWKEMVPDDRLVISIDARPHPDPHKDVAVFAVPRLALLPAIPLGDHLDDWITDHDFVLNEVLVLGFPPIPLSRKNVLVATRAQINAVVDLINVEHVHFIVSAMARGGFSGGVVLSEWGFALGVVTSSLLKNGAPEELGYLTVLTVEPILECLAASGLLPRELALQWDGLFTAVTQYFGDPERGLAHSWIETDRDGHRARISFATPDPRVVSAAMAAMDALEGIEVRKEVHAIDIHVWDIIANYDATAVLLERTQSMLGQLLLDQGYLPVATPKVIVRSLESAALA